MFAIIDTILRSFELTILFGFAVIKKYIKSFEFVKLHNIINQDINSRSASNTYNIRNIKSLHY